MTYTVKVKLPKNITLHYTNHDITTTNIKHETSYTLTNVNETEMDELFRSGIVLSAVKNKV